MVRPFGIRRPTAPELWAASWTVAAVWTGGRQLRRGTPAGALRLPSAAAVPASGRAAVPAVLRTVRSRCLIRALVLQAWRTDHGDPVDVILGVTAPSAGFTAHAWIDDEAGASEAGPYQPLHRLTPPVRSSVRPA